jgi:hypothetical protein
LRQETSDEPTCTEGRAAAQGHTKLLPRLGFLKDSSSKK